MITCLTYANNLNPLDGSYAQQDTDNDVSSNIAEFETGTDPNDPNSTPEVSNIPETISGGVGMGGMFFTLMLVLSRINGVRFWAF